MLVEQEEGRQTLVEDTEAVKKTEEMTDEAALKQTVEIATESEQAVKQIVETNEDIKTMEVIDKQPEKHTEEVAEKPSVTRTEDCRQMQYNEETLKVIEGLCDFSVAVVNFNLLYTLWFYACKSVFCFL